ncbi:MAG: DUF2285 domain-containing protein [Hyphomicrobiales bacterium]|nr:DUF2285 domain-containing protein [Hyphomicrobiales bacterium]
MRAFSAGTVPNSPVYRVLEHPSLCRTVQAVDGAQHLLFQDSGKFLQVSVQGAELAEPVHLLSEVIQSPSILKHQLQVVEHFNALIVGGTLRRTPFSPNLRSQRLCTAVLVLDGRQAGASYRDIAVALFGPDRVNEDWNAGGDHLKNRIRRAAQRGNFLMQGGYRVLLK